MYGSYSYNQYERSDVVTGLSSAVMAEACATSEEAEEADFRDWATSNKISSKAVDMLVKDGFNSMDAIVLLERDDLSSKMPRGQQKLLLKALQYFLGTVTTRQGQSPICQLSLKGAPNCASRIFGKCKTLITGYTNYYQSSAAFHTV